jgi:WS/DGAT/MGAT family acyltransferase
MNDRADDFMGGTDAFSWYLEKDPGLRATIVAVAWLDRAPDAEVFAARLEHATRLAPRFRQRPVEPPARLANPRWVETEFDLSLHLHRMESPSPHTAATVVEYARLQAMTGFDRSRPLWQFTLIEHVDGDRAALVMKVHHSLTDGIGGMQLAFLLFETTRLTAPVPVVPGPVTGALVHTLGTAALVRESLVHDARRLGRVARRGLVAALPAALRSVRDPWHSLTGALDTVRSLGRFVEPVSDTLSPLMTGRSLDRYLDMIAVDLGDLKRAARTVDGTVNDAFVAAVTGGLRRYHEHHGTRVGDLRITLPISTRKEGDAPGGNHITLERFRVPVGLADVAERMRQIGHRCRTARDDRAVPMSDAVAGTLNLLPSGVVASMLKHIDFLASNVPGVPVPIFLAGAEVTGYYVFGPTTGSAVNVTLLSYRGTCCVGFTVDAGAVPDGQVLMDCFRQGFEEVLALAGEHLPVELPLRAVPEPGAGTDGVPVPA